MVINRFRWRSSTSHLYVGKMNMEYDIQPKQAWRLADRLLRNVSYDSGFEEKNEWVYTSSESEDHRDRFMQWITSKEIEASKNIWMLISYPAEDTKEMRWCEFLDRWTEFLSDTDLKITDKSFTWVFEYKSQRIARFGRKINSNKTGDDNSE